MRTLSRGRKGAALVVAVAAIVLTVSIAGPAVGVPSISSVAKKARKGLKTAKKANKRAKKAQRTANTANSKADQALARPVVTGSNLVPVAGPTESIPPGGFESAIAFCPTGYRIVSGGGSVITAAGGIDVSDYNDARTAWFVIGEDLAGGGGTVQATALCARAGTAAVAKAPSRAEVQDEVDAVVARLRAKR